MSTSVRRVSHLEILCAPNAQQLIDEYAAECSTPYAVPQIQMYAALELSGVLVCFGAYAAEELVGFVSMLNVVSPHNGARIATVESLFVSDEHRAGGTGDALLAAAEQYAEASGWSALVYTARVGSRLDKVLSRRAGCELSHTMYTRWLE